METKDKVDLQVRFIEMAHDELLEALRAQRWSINCAAVIIGVSASASVSTYKEKYYTTSGMLLIVAGVLTAILFTYWAGEFLKITRSSKYCWEAESIIRNIIVQDDILLLEGWLRKKGENGKDGFIILPYVAIQIAFAIFSAAQVAVGSILLSEVLSRAILFIIFTCSFGLMLIFFFIGAKETKRCCVQIREKDGNP
ncbi:hypothetical protein [Azospirillum sp. Sh1]|uniref:hypothetical protein n=1 Tax=Azospirillum sp. Sh1 TaxID=2607285 RepID=UPI0011EEB95B|nr:hypothetical protein [Azospirillum sp. Sh1]KAA0573055.1 hypothetical protein FZ029_21850 [Azospirillum sp. Sh1]